MNAIVISGIWGVVMMFSGLFVKKDSAIRGIAVLGMIILLAANILEMRDGSFFPFDTRNMLSFDSFSLLFNAVAFACALMFFLLSGRDMRTVGDSPADYYALLFFVLCGVSIVSSFNTLLMLFLGIEIISIPLYVLTGADKRNLKGNEASLKYLLMGAFSTGLMLMGITLVYGAKGSFDMDVIGAGNAEITPLMSAGLLLLMFSMAFKVSAAPFHFWTPDVYDGAPTVITSFMATIVKAAGFIAFIRLFQGCFASLQGQWQLIAAIIAASTLVIGNVTALFQQSVKRMLAYSSISQAGFMMFAIVSLNSMAVEGLLYYALAYCMATIGAFAILARMNDYTFDGYNGMGKHHPFLAATNVVFMLSLAGIPATAGFMGKFYMLSAAINNGQVFWLVVLGVVCAAISVYYYFRVIQAMYFKDGPRQEIEAGSGFKVLLAVLSAAIILLGIFPQSLIDLLYYFF
ncbi:MAG TPA: NADH-quinone oxidoreductase subunit N [Flavitalea sp.]|nr:NADH-quinone oxidoreductase subunit N [Flavitalea sp.]